MTTGIVTMEHKESEGRQLNKVSVQLSIWCTLCKDKDKSTLSNCCLALLVAENADTPNCVRSK